MRLLPLLLLPFASGLEARTRQSATQSQSAVAPPSTPSKTALLVVAGLTRHFERTWPKIQDSLLKPNEADGYKFTILVSTSTGLGCKPDTPNFNSRKCEISVDKNWHVQRIKSIMAPNEVEVLDHSGDLCSAETEPTSASRLLATASTLNETGGFEGNCAPWYARVAKVLGGVAAGGQKFDRVLAIRPDIAIRWTVQWLSSEGNTLGPVRHPAWASNSKSGSSPQLMIDHMCEERPGINMVTPAWTIQHRSWLHDRDLDFAQIMCPGERLDVYLDAMRAVGDHCHLRKGDKEPTIPSGFRSTKGWNEFGYFCRFVQVFNKTSIGMHHWDDTFTCDWD